MKLFFLLFVIFSFAFILMLFKSNNQFKFEIEQQRQEIEASSRYIELLTDELVQNNPAGDHSELKTDNLSELMSSYHDKNHKTPERRLH